MNEGNKVKKNIFITLILNIVTIINGLILPRLFILAYSSDINGAVVSISQFLSYITFLEAGVGVVVCAALYKPLACNDIREISSVICETERFYKKIALIYLVYMFGIALIYPFIVPQFGERYTFALVLVIGLSTFCQYYFGITYQLLLNADRKIWINSLFSIFALVCNLIISVIMIYQKVDILLIKLACSIIYMIRPIILKLYVKKQYKLENIETIGNNVLKQKWYGLGHHIASFVHLNTDVVLLTFFEPISEVSVYSVYSSISISIRSIIKGVSEGMVASLGNLLATGKKDKICSFFRAYLLFNIVFVCILFTVSGILVCPFVELYISNTTDVDYIRREFAIILFVAEAIYCFRLPYQDVVFSSGHFHQTRISAYLEAIINALMTIILIQYYGMIGAVVGTFFATLFRLFSYVRYLSKEILYIDLNETIKKYIGNALLCIISILIVNSIKFQFTSWAGWVINAVIIFVIVSLIFLLGNFGFYRKDMCAVFKLFKKEK